MSEYCHEALVELTDDGGFWCELPDDGHTEHVETGSEVMGWKGERITYRMTWTRQSREIVDAAESRREVGP